MVSVRPHARRWRAYLTRGGLVLAGISLVRGLMEPKNQQQVTPEQQDTEATPKNIEYGTKHPPSYRYRHYQRPDEAEHRVAEQIYWRGSFWLTATTTLAAIFAAVFAILGWDLARRTAEDAHQTVIETTRQADAASKPYVFGRFVHPLVLHNWITALKPANPGMFGQTNNRTKIELTNYGQSPAILISVKCAPIFGGMASVNFAQIDIYNTPDATDFVPRTILFKDPVLVSCFPWPVNLRVMKYKANMTADDKFSFVFEHPIWMVARVTYEDVSGKTDTLLVCARLEYGRDSFMDLPAAFSAARAPECRAD